MYIKGLYQTPDRSSTLCRDLRVLLGCVAAHQIFFDVFITFLTSKSSEETLHLQNMQHCACNMKHHIAYNLNKYNSFYNSHVILINIMQVTNVFIVPIFTRIDPFVLISSHVEKPKRTQII